MFKIVTFKSNIISCQERLLKKKKSHIVFPSELDSFWFENIQNPQLDKPRLLYVGRMKVEKGIFSLTNMLHKINADYEFSVVGGSSEKFSLKDRQNKKIIFFPFCQETNSLISSYDKNNIFILPSFTEAHPKVVDESLARRRPLIVFEEIKHVIKDRKGIFVCKRNEESLLEMIRFIMKNYKNIQESMKKNKLPTKKEFISQMSDILRLN
jgi:glycosyltransferase involved in cell wall biosynthesis